MWQAADMHPPLVSALHALLILLPMLWVSPASAWGAQGHRITALIADSLLTPAARRQVQNLLGEASLADASVYMDQQRQMLSARWPAADRWHYDNQPVCSNSGHCADGHCATRQIERFRKLLADPTASRSDRALALRLVLHMLGDIHQPLHMADNTDRGGNNLYVRMYAGAERQNLHEVMDTVLIKQLLGAQRTRDYAQQLQQRYRLQLPSWQQGTVQQWAEQTHLLAVNHTYGDLPGFACGRELPTITLSNEYLQQARQYLPEQLARAGARIAAVLNGSLH